MNDKIKQLLGLCMVAVFLTGCNDINNSETLEKINTEEYVKNLYETEEVVMGDITEELKLFLKADEFVITPYTINKEELQVKEINVEKGDYVTAGTVMVSFVDDDIVETINGYQQRRDEDILLIEHYQRLQNIDPSLDYKDDIEGLQTDIQIIDAYIREEQGKLADYQLVAKMDGVVSDINAFLLDGVAYKGTILLKVASGSTNFIAHTTDSYDFSVGDEYEANLDFGVYTMKIIDIREGENGKDIIFKPMSDMSSVSTTDVLSMTIVKPTISNVLYVPANSVNRVEDRDYVYVMEEDGYMVAREVTVEQLVNEYAIISSGVEAGEKVVVK